VPLAPRGGRRATVLVFHGEGKGTRRGHRAGSQKALGFDLWFCSYGKAAVSFTGEERGGLRGPGASRPSPGKKNNWTFDRKGRSPVCLPAKKKKRGVGQGPVQFGRRAEDGWGGCHPLRGLLDGQRRTPASGSPRAGCAREVQNYSGGGGRKSFLGARGASAFSQKQGVVRPGHRLRGIVAFGGAVGRRLRMAASVGPRLTGRRRFEAPGPRGRSGGPMRKWDSAKSENTV